MKTLILLITFVAATSQAATILILPYGAWSLEQASCADGSPPIPEISAHTRNDLHLRETGDFEAPAVTASGWSVLRGGLVVDHATASLCLKPQERMGSGQVPQILDAHPVCGAYAVDFQTHRLTLTFANGWDGRTCTDSQELILTYQEMR